MFRAELHSARLKQNAKWQLGPRASLFGEQVQSDEYLVDLALDSVHPMPAYIVEWVVERGPRIWIVRITREEPAGTNDFGSLAAFAASLSRIKLSSTALNVSSNISVTNLLNYRGVAAPGSELQTIRFDVPQKIDTAHAHLTNLSYPYWWNGSACDTSLLSTSYPLGAYYLGMPACGPLNTAYVTSKFPGTQQYEWQCVELVMRYMYLAYGMPAYYVTAGGGSVVQDYNGSYPFQKISNGTTGQVPQPGDILSYNTSSPAGHTSIATSTSVDGSGNGNIQVIAENSTASGWDTLSVQNWVVRTNWGGVVSGWLHDPNHGGSSGPPGTPTLQSPGNGSTQTSRTVTFSWSAPNSPNLNGYTLHVSTTSTIDGSGANLVVDQGVGGTSYAYTFSQDYSTLWWSVAAWNTSGQRGNWASPWTITINTAPPLSAPSLQAPGNGSATNNRAVTFSWSPPSSMDPSTIQGYTLHISTTSTIDGSGANLILDTGVGGTTYTYTFSQDYSTVWWSVATWNTSGQRSNWASASTLTVDTAKPTVTLVAPTATEWGVAYCNNDVLTLQVNVTDNMTVSWVDFMRADSVLNKWVDLGTVYQPVTGNIYQETLDCSTIPATWNQMWVAAGDEAGNWSSADFWIYHFPPPVAPSSLIAQVATCTEINLSWTDNSGGQDYFNIYRNGTLVGSAGADSTSYIDRWLAGNSSYTYTVTAVSGSLESNPATTAIVSTPTCPPPPTVNFTSPVSDGGTVLCQDPMTISLQVSASSSVGITSVQFYWWDAVHQQSVDISIATGGPYQTTVNCRMLSYAWNLIWVAATDTSGQESDTYMWIYLQRPQAGQGQPSTSGNCSNVPRSCQL